MAQSAAVPVETEDRSGESPNAVFFSRGCCSFFNFQCFKSRKSDNWERIPTSGEEQESIRQNWWGMGIDAVKKVREWSELVAGPKWKTFIRRFNRTGGRGRLGKFQYDPLSYSLNFEDRRGQNWEFESDLVCRDFSARYSAIPVQNVHTTSSMK